jgi:PKD repeat protein
MIKLIKKLKQISILLLVISFIGCENDVVLLPQVISGFTHTINTETSTVTFINTSVNARNYFWTFGDGTSSTEMNPIKTYSRGEYRVTLKAINVAGASDTSEDIIVISDVGAPVITLLGNTTMNILVGGSYTDPGATALDDEDGDVTANIVVGGDTVDVNTAGTYIVTYNVSDAAGNAATQRTRTVIVAADIVAPVITLTGSVTINSALGNSFTDPGATATDNVDGDITANIVVAGDAVDINTAGTYTITYNVSDASGNAATEVTRTVIVTDPNACVAETTQSLAAADFNVTFQTTNTTATILTEASTIVRVANPDSNNSVNSSCYVGEFKRLGGAGTEYAHNKFVLSTGVDLVANAGFKIKVWSPVVGAKLTVKLEGGNEALLSKSTTTANAWEELTFDFSTGQNDANNKSIVLFFNIETTAAATLYYDDFRLYARTGGGGGGGGGTTSGIANNGDFETGTLDGWAVYTNGGIIIADNTENNGGSWSGKLVASAPSGLNPTLKQERKGAGTIVAGDRVQIKFDYKGSTAGGGIYSIQSFVEATNGVNQTTIFSVTPTAAWQTFTQTYTVNAGDVSGGITMEFTAICGGVAGCTSTLYLDNVSVTINP